MTEHCHPSETSWRHMAMTLKRHAPSNPRKLVYTISIDFISSLSFAYQTPGSIDLLLSIVFVIIWIIGECLAQHGALLHTLEKKLYNMFVMFLSRDDITQHEVLTHCLLHTLVTSESYHVRRTQIHPTPSWIHHLSIDFCSRSRSALSSSLHHALKLLIVYLKKLHHIVMSTTCLIRHLIVFGVTLGLRLKHVLTGCRLFITMPFGLEWPSSSISLTSNASYLHPPVELYRHE